MTAADPYAAARALLVALGSAEPGQREQVAAQLRLPPSDLQRAIRDLQGLLPYYAEPRPNAVALAVEETGRLRRLLASAGALVEEALRTEDGPRRDQLLQRVLVLSAARHDLAALEAALGGLFGENPVRPGDLPWPGGE